MNNLPTLENVGLYAVLREEQICTYGGTSLPTTVSIWPFGPSFGIAFEIIDTFKHLPIAGYVPWQTNTF